MPTPFQPMRSLLATAVLCTLALASGAAVAGGNSGSTTLSTSQPSEVPAEMLVKARSADALPRLLARYPVTLVSRFGARPIFRFRVVGSARVKDVVAAMSLDTDVMIAEANATHRSPEARRNLPWAIGTAQAWSTQWAPQAMRLPEAQRLASGAGVRVAVLDTGIDRNHPLLAGRVLPGRDFVDADNDPSESTSTAGAGWGHGTHVAGLVALAAPAAQILPVRVLDADGAGNAWVLAEALLYAIDPDGNPATDDGAQVINLSLGSLGRTRILDTIAQIVSCAPAVPDDAIGDRSDPGYRDDETRCANSRGALVVAAAGNDASSSVKEYPAAEGAYGLLAVGASNASGRLASFSNSGSWIDLAAPGDAITSALPGGAWGTWGGTSMAAPLVSGTAALIRSREPALAPKDVAVRLKRNTAALCGDTRLEQVDALAALTGGPAAPVVCR